MASAIRESWALPHIFSFEGQEVRYGVLGAGKPLVLLHGTPFSSAVWRRIAPRLAKHRQVFYFDLLGYGRSEMRPQQDVSLGVQNRVFASLLDHWGIARPDVVAHDFGGATALRAHLLNACEFRTLTLIDPVAIAPWGSPFVRHVRQHEEAFRGLPAYIHRAILS
ncbi:MAG TPA: alpha/beta fold hydrolase, partial [Steroidobacteraceae bacterium]|nr:alpha/beta fold hydrolase [Steroidobacteraceae bacterium]